jgi:hypothetical protein
VPSAARYVVLVLALLVTSRVEPPTRAGTPERDACTATYSIGSICVSKRVEVPARDGRNHAKESKLLAPPPCTYALAEPDRQRACERPWYVATDHGAAPPMLQSARAPPQA